MSITGVGRLATVVAEQEPTGRHGPKIEFRDVYKSFGQNHVLNGLTMTIPAGRITMIMGPSGTGKSVCIGHIVGLLHPDSGEVLVGAVPLESLDRDELLDLRRDHFGVLFQDGALFSSMSVADNVAFPLRQHTSMSEHDIGQIVRRRLTEVGLAASIGLRPSELSGGMRKRVAFARALAMNPDVVLFDEPDSGLDPVRAALLCELIRDLHESNGGTYVVVTHDMLSAQRIAEHICVLWQGKLVESGSAPQVLQSEDPFVRQFLRGESHGPLGME